MFKRFKAFWVIHVLIALLWLVIATNVQAVIYKYVDRNGTVCFSDSLQTVPAEFRKKAVIVSEDKGEGIPAGKVSPDGTVQAPARQEGQAAGEEGDASTSQGLMNSRLFKPAVVLALFIAGFLAVGRLSSSLGGKQVGTIIRIMLALGVLVYLISSYVTGINSAYDSIKGELTKIRSKVDEKEKKTREAVEEIRRTERPGE